jgi:uncharacterized heparinase superfamily protein
MAVEARLTANQVADPPLSAVSRDSWGRRTVSPGVWWRTVREFRIPQVLHLLQRRFLAFPRRMRVVPGRKELRPLPGAIRFADWRPEAARAMLETRSFTFLNKASPTAPTIPWNSEELSLHWLFNLNYCDFLNLDLTQPSDSPLLRQALGIALDWIRQNPRGSETGWMPYPLSVRIVNWLKFLVRNNARLRELGEQEAIQEMLRSLADQAATLRRRLEFDLLANHFLKNIKALIFCGALIDSVASDDWWQSGERFLTRQLGEQILSDGGHFERSPMYHAQVLEDLIDIRAVTVSAGRPLLCAELLTRKIAGMADFLGAVLHPDGSVPPFNDSTLSGARPAAELITMASGDHGPAVVEAPAVARVFPSTGYAVLRDPATDSALVFDCGAVGPDFNPGHAHADVLSYELSLHGQRVIVDTGVSTYEPGDERLYERSTAAHNTVRIDGEDQAELWASFRVGRRPRVGAPTAGEVQGFRFVRGRHFAYKHRGASHYRVIVRTPEGAWVVVDWLQGSGTHRAESFVHFHPSIRILFSEASATPESLTVAVDYRNYRLVTLGAGKLEPITTWYAPEFGVRHQRVSIRWSWHGTFPVLLSYALVPEGAPVPRIEKRTDAGAVLVDGARIPAIYCKVVQKRWPGPPSGRGSLAPMRFFNTILK